MKYKSLKEAELLGWRVSVGHQEEGGFVWWMVRETRGSRAESQAPRGPNTLGGSRAGVSGEEELGG